MAKIKTIITGNFLYSNSKEAYALSNKRGLGEKKQDKVEYTPLEVLFLVNEDKMEIFQKDKLISKQEILKKFQNNDKNFHSKYVIFEDLRKKGYIVKTGLKFGADFRVYEKWKELSKEHAKWIVFVQKSDSKINWNEFSSKNRVAHSTKKNLLIAIVDEEGGILYYEIKWMKL